MALVQQHTNNFFVSVNRFKALGIDRMQISKLTTRVLIGYSYDENGVRAVVFFLGYKHPPSTSIRIHALLLLLFP